MKRVTSNGLILPTTQSRQIVSPQANFRQGFQPSNFSEYQQYQSWLAGQGDFAAGNSGADYSNAADFDAAVAPFPADVQQLALSIMFENEGYIADMVMPRVPAGGQVFSWKRYRAGETYRRQQTRVGRTGTPNKVEFGFDEVESKTEDNGLDVPVPQSDLDEAAHVGYNPIDSAMRKSTNFLMLEREIRVASLVNTAGNYSRTTTLTGTQRFSDPASDPIGVISTALRLMIRRANTMVISEDGWDVLSRNPQIVRAYNGNEGNAGIASVDFIKQLFRLQNIFIGQSWVDNTSTGLAIFPNDPITNLTRIWTDNLALLYIDLSANLQEGLTWGMTAQWKQRFQKQWFDQNIGLEGGVMCRVGEHTKEVVTAPEYGHLIIDLIA